MIHIQKVCFLGLLDLESGLPGQALEMLSARLLLTSGRCRPWKCLNPDFSCKTCCLRCSLSVSSRQETSWVWNAKKYEDWNQAKFCFTTGHRASKQGAHAECTLWLCGQMYVFLLGASGGGLCSVSAWKAWSGSNVLWLLMEQHCSFSVGLCYLWFIAKLHFHPSSSFIS